MPLPPTACRVDVELGLHFCYGNPGGKHIIEPRDLSNLVAFCNLIVPRIKRPLTWVHMPVPIARSDDSYFASLRDLRLSEATEFYLGLVHLDDGLKAEQNVSLLPKKRGRNSASRRNAVFATSQWTPCHDCSIFIAR